MHSYAQNNPVFPLSQRERAAFESLRRRAERADFVSREVSAVIDMATNILGLDADEQRRALCRGRELYERVQTVDGPMLVRLY